MKKKKKQIPKAYLLILLMECMGVFLWGVEWYQSGPGFDGTLYRKDTGEGDYTETIEVETKGYAGDVEVLVEEKKLSEEEADHLLQQAVEEVDATFLGENQNLEQICKDVVMKDSYQKGLVEAEWTLDDYTYVTGEGKIQREELSESVLVNAAVTLSYESYQQIYQFSFLVLPPEKGTEESIQRDLGKVIQQQSAEEEVVELPDTLQGQQIHWKKKKEGKGVGLCILGAVAMLLIPYGERKEKEKAKRQQLESQKRDYPLLIDELSLLLSCGMGLAEAAGKITARYEKRKKRTRTVQEGFELWSHFYYEMKDGVSEYKAVEHLGKYTDLKEYRKLSLLLLQNQKQGGGRMLQQLEQEQLTSYEMRKNLAKKEGEEASVKLLFPMIGMLGVVLVILLLPALMTLGSM